MAKCTAMQKAEEYMASDGRALRPEVQSHRTRSGEDITKVVLLDERGVVVWAHVAPELASPALKETE